MCIFRKNIEHLLQFNDRTSSAENPGFIYRTCDGAVFSGKIVLQKCTFSDNLSSMLTKPVQNKDLNVTESRRITW